MSQSPPSAALSAASSTNFEQIFSASLEEYKKRTKKDIASHPLAAQLQSCKTPGAISDLLQAQAPAFDKSQSSHQNLTKWLGPTVNVLCSFSATLGSGVGRVFPPATAIFTGIGVLLQTNNDGGDGQDSLMDLLSRIGFFLTRLEKYIEVRPTAAMKDNIVKIMVEVLSILGIVTKEVRKGPMEYIKALGKKLAGTKDIEEALQKLDELTEKEVQMAHTEALDNVYKIEDGTKNLKEKVGGADEKIKSISTKLESIDIKVQDVGGKIQAVNVKVSSAIESGMEAKAGIQQVAVEMRSLLAHRDRVRQDLEKWISPPDLSVNYITACEAHHEGTATWCTQGATYADWKASGSLLWIHGKPGSGKSILSSVIIRDIKAGSGSIAYFYFDFKDTGKQDHRALLSSLLVQLSNQSDRFCDVLHGLYSKHQNESRPDNASLLRCLKDMLTVAESGPVYLVMDALDECPKNSGVPSSCEKVLEVVKELVELRLPNLRLCVTSRPEFDICKALEPLNPLCISLHDEDGQKEDIFNYVTYKILSHRKMKEWRGDVQKMAIESLAEKADGMFRWVDCQLDVLRHLPQCDLAYVRRVLEELPKSLDETYERILKGVNKAQWKYAYLLLRCLTVAVRPLRVEELAEVVAVDFSPGEIPKMNADWRWEDQEEAVLSACSSLVAVIIDNGSRVVQFSHFSVKEFLTSDRLATQAPKFYISLEPAHATLSQACLCVLLCLDDQADEDSKSIPLVRYAAEHWVEHAQIANEELGITDTMDYFLDMDKPHFSAWVRIQGLNDLLRRSRSEQPRTAPPPAAPLYFAAENGFRGLVERMIVKHPTHLNTWGGVYGTPLHASVLGGHIEVARFLVTRVAEVDARSADDWTPLHFAANNGHLEISRILFEHHAEVNSRDRDGRTPLHYASWKGHLDVVRLLLDRGADASIRDNSDLSPLYFAMTSRQLDVARILLLKHEAEANARDDLGRTFLHCASAQGHDDVVLFFLDLHADVDARDNRGNTPLHWAASNGNLGVTRILLEHNAEVMARDEEGSTPLHKASDGEPDVVQLLLDWNADMYACDDSGQTPLHIAAATESFEIARILFEHVRKHLPE